MSSFIKKSFFTLVVIILTMVISLDALFAKTVPEKHALVLVPNHKTQRAQEQLVANLVTQKFFLSLKKNKNYQKIYRTNFIFVPYLKSEDPQILASYYITQKNYKNAIIISTQYNEKNQKYKISIDFFYGSRVVQNLDSILFTTTFQEVLSALSLFDIVNMKNSAAIKKTLSQMIDVTSDISQNSVITIAYAHEDIENPEPYFVRINGKLLEEISPKKIIIREKKNFIEILEINQDDSTQYMKVGSFVVSPILSQYKVIIKPSKEKQAQLVTVPSAARITFLKSLVTTNVLLGYSYLALSQNIFTSPHFLSGSARITVSPNVPFFFLGLEVPFIVTTTGTSEEKSYSFLGLSAFLSGVFPIANNTEFIIHGGAGFFSISTLTMPKIIKNINHETQIQPEANGGLAFAYNIPIQDAGYVRILFDVSARFSILKSVDSSNKRSGPSPRILRSLQKTAHNTPLLFISTSLGFGIRF